MNRRQLGSGYVFLAAGMCQHAVLLGGTGGGGEVLVYCGLALGGDAGAYSFTDTYAFGVGAIRTCVREDVTDINQAQRVLNHELYRYNHQQVHSTTQDIPYLRCQKALREKRSLFRAFQFNPYQSTKDIFCLRMDRTIDPYRRISINILLLKINHATPGKTVNLRIYPSTIEVSEIRYWCEGKLIDVQRVKNSDLKGMHF